jgi:phosphatidylserine/phosphatidylglycerophosphate/cardiolipin synthase-like enzyme
MLPTTTLLTDRASGGDNGSVFLDDEVLPQILQVVRNASQLATFVTPYVRLWGHLQSAMDEAIGRGVAISFVVRAGERNQSEELEWLRDHDVKVYEVPHLHAKIYLNERTVLVSSMNITERSTTNSLEFAMTVRSEDDSKRLRDYVARLTGKVNASRPARSVRQEAEQAGICIRDGSKMDFNLARPLCAKCYLEWAKYKNEDYEEKYCHSCGRRTKTTYARPLCLECYKKLN